MEQQLETEFLHLACRHHILELVLRSVVEVYWKVTSGPNMAIFQRFQNERDKMDRTNFKTGIQDKLSLMILVEQEVNLLEFISN